MKTATGNAILAILRRHVGRAQAITAPGICRALNFPVTRERLVRRIIADESALWPEIIVCATPGEGYFCAETFEEIERYDHWRAHLATDAAAKHAAFRAAARRAGFAITDPPLLAAAA